MSNFITLYKKHHYYISPMIRNSLGNNLFQIAAICSYAYDDNIKYIIEDTGYTGSHKTFNKDNITLCNLFPNLNCVNSHKYYWDLYNCEYKKDNSENIVPIKDYINNRLKTKLIGTFISHKYFNHNRKYILQLFDFSPEIKKNILDKYQNILDKYITISVHIRRGDFIRNLHLKKWCLLGTDYYEKAFNLILNLKHENIIFLFFYEDHESKQWIINNLIQLINNHKYLLISNLAHEDMFFMSQCNHNIIANSTFSFWGAYLNNNHNRIIIAPSSWKFDDTEIDTKRRFPSEWKIIESNCNLSLV